MQNKKDAIEDIIIMRYAGWMWLAYILVLMVLDLYIFRVGLRHRLSSYYIANSASAVLFIILAYWKWGFRKLGKVMIVGLILLISVLPIIMNHFIAPRMPPGPMANAEGMALRLFPVLFIGLVLTAWQYRFAEVALYSIGIAFLEMVTVLVLVKDRVQILQLFALINMVRTTSFLAIGFFITRMMALVHQQQYDLRSTNAKLTQYTHVLEELTISRERNRMARELHDTLAHSLTALSVQLETVRAYWTVDSKKAQKLLDRSLEITRAGTEETRRALKSLRASPLEDLGLGLAVKQLTLSASDRAGLKTAVRIPDEINLLSNEEQQAVYRIAQESIENVIKHASASQITILIDEDDDEFRMSISDDGVGYMKEESKDSGFGILGMRERANLVGGELEIQSKKGEGCTVVFRLNRSNHENTHM
jgi:signal transduction histidine kinase